MVERGPSQWPVLFDLAMETAACGLGLEQLGAHELQGHESSGQRLLRLVDDAHAAGAEASAQPVATDGRRLSPFGLGPQPRGAHA